MSTGSFKGFPAGKARYTFLPDQFFSELLPVIGDLAELKVTLHLFWLLHRQSDYPRYVSGSQLRSDTTLLRGLHETAKSTADALEYGLEQAVARKVFLRLTVWEGYGRESITDQWYFLNDPEGRRACGEIKEGALQLEINVVPPMPLPQEKPSVYALYERYIGLLSPVITQELVEAAEIYPSGWIEEAFEIAVERGIRRWRYIRGILERWRREGKDGGQT